VKRFPTEFEALLSPLGRRILAGKVPKLKGALGRTGILAIPELIDARIAKAAPALLEKAFGDVMPVMSKTVPPHDVLLRKTARARATSNDPTGPAAVRGLECGLIECLRSESYKRFAELLAGEKLWGPHTMQVLCNRRGDYAGPHTDAYPEDRWAQHGYFDFHLTFCNAAVKRQLIVYEVKGQLTEVREIATMGGLTAYRLPLWHYTTPLEVKNDSAKRWIVMNGFFQHAHSPETDPKPTVDELAAQFKERINQRLDAMKGRPV
jgi:hypothetical protein